MICKWSLNANRKGWTLVPHSGITNIKEGHIHWVTTLNPWDEEENMQIFVILNEQKCQSIWMIKGKTWVHVMDMASAQQSMSIINDGPGKDKSVLWYRRKGVCAWHYAGLNNCTQFLKQNPSCAFIAWYAPQWIREERKTIMIKWAHNNVKIGNVVFNIVDPGGGYNRITIHCISQQKSCVKKRVKPTPPWYGQIVEHYGCEKNDLNNVRKLMCIICSEALF